jgi:hypothetical protein
MVGRSHRGEDLHCFTTPHPMIVSFALLYGPLLLMLESSVRQYSVSRLCDNNLAFEPLSVDRVEGEVILHDFTILQTSALHDTSPNWSLQSVVTTSDGEIGDRNLPNGGVKGQLVLPARPSYGDSLTSRYVHE